MKIKPAFMIIPLLALSSLQLGMGHREGQYDEEAREEERQAKAEKKNEEHEARHPIQNFAGGVKQAAVDGPAGLISDTTEGTEEGKPVMGTLEGARVGSEKLLDNTVKGAVKVATLGYGHVDHYEVQEPEKGTDEPTKIKIKL